MAQAYHAHCARVRKFCAIHSGPRFKHALANLFDHRWTWRAAERAGLVPRRGHPHAYLDDMLWDIMNAITMPGAENCAELEGHVRTRDEDPVLLHGIIPLVGSGAAAATAAPFVVAATANYSSADGGATADGDATADGGTTHAAVAPQHDDDGDTAMAANADAAGDGDAATAAVPFRTSADPSCDDDDAEGATAAVAAVAPSRRTLADVTPMMATADARTAPSLGLTLATRGGLANTRMPQREWATTQIGRPLTQALRTTLQLRQALAAPATFAAGDAGALNDQTGVLATTKRVAEMATTIAQSEDAMQQLDASGIGDLRTSLRTPVAMDLAATELPFERRAAMPIGDRGANNTAIPMPIGLSGNLFPGIAARVVTEPPQGGDAARATDGAVARAAAADGNSDAARAANDDSDEVLAGGLGADGDGRAAAGGSTRAPTARSRTAMPADERKRRRAAAEQARRLRSRQLIGAAEAAAAQDGPLTDEQRRVLDGRDRERARCRAKRRRTATENDDCGDREELAVAAAVIAHLAD